MAKSNAVWGIDIGQCALKALKCRPHEKEPHRIVVESFDYIEYPKILSQPEADPAELVRHGLEQFLSRNEVADDRVAIAVAGQSGLARFIKLPPVESKKIPDIVKYEARQQIPFALEDVVWDYQQLRGGSEEDGFALEPEVGLFAMKRDQVGRALEPLEAAGIEVDIIQLTPLAVYNYTCFDRFEDLQSQSYDPENPPTSTVVISLGTDTTDLVVTNGFRVWQRNIPIGGNHFTRALSKELRLTFAKAEHLKRHATQADDPKAVFQAMRPVFSDLLAEIQRSLGYFTSIDKSAKIGETIVLGNAMKLPGLQRYLSQNLDQDVRAVDSFQNLSEGSAAASAQFKENILGFGVAYGLCVQGLGKSEISTNLLPEEIVRSRMIRAKKPWAVAGIAALFVGLTFNYYTHVAAWSDTQTEAMARAISGADSAQRKASDFDSQRQEILTAFTSIEEIGDKLTSNVEGRLLWMEMFKGLYAAIPKDTRPEEQRKETSEDISGREEVHITALTQRHYDDLRSERYAVIEEFYLRSRGLTATAASGVDAYAEEDPTGGADAGTEGESFVDEDASGEESDGPDLPDKGWVIQLTGFHYHNLKKENQTSRFVNNTLIKNLEEMSVPLPDGPDGELIDVPLSDLGISRPWLVQGTRLKEVDPRMRGNQSRRGNRGGYGETNRPGASQSNRNNRTRGDSESGDDPQEPVDLKVQRYDFVVELFWRPTTRSERRELAKEREQLAREQVEAAAAVDENDTSGSEPSA